LKHYALATLFSS